MKLRHLLLALPAVLLAVGAIAGTTVISTWTPGSGITCDASNVCTASGAASLAVKDGSTTVSSVTTIDFTSGATVTSGGAGQANVAVSGGSGPTIAAGTNVTISEGTPCSSGTCTINSTGAGGFSGFFSTPSSVSVPTASNTGFSSWVNQGGASVADYDDGIRITAPAGSGDNLRCRSQTAPSTPYTRTAILGLEATIQNYQAAFVGWYDGTKLHLIGITTTSDSGSTIAQVVQRYSAVGTFNSTDASWNTETTRAIVEIGDDGTNITFKSYRWGSPNIATLYSTTHGGGYLANYNTLVFCANRNNNQGSSSAFGNLLYWQ